MALIKIDEKQDAKYIDGTKLGHREKLIARTFAGFLKGHPCQGARISIVKGGVFLSIASDMTSVESAFNVLNDLREYFGVSDSLGATEKTLAVAFYAEPIGSQEQFAEQYWKFVQLLHDLDCQTFEWDNTVSPLINDTNFELSLSGRAIFTTTLNPLNPRFARKFSYPVWVMNQLSQFNWLRQNGLFSNWQHRIRELDSKFDPSGVPNPILTDHGQASSAAQLAGSAPETLNFSYRSTSSERALALETAIEQARKEGCPFDIVMALESLRR